MKIRSLLLAGLVVLVLGVTAWLWRFVSKGEERPPSPLASARIGTILSDISAPVFIAQQRGYFSEENLKTDIVLFQTGAEATTALLEKRVDFVTAAEYVFVLNAFKNEDLRILGVIGTGQFTEVIARPDRGISRPEDLRGKRIGVSRGTHGEYYLGRFLAVHGLLPKEVEIIDMKPADQAIALTTGQVDAVVAWEPNLSTIKRQVTEEVVTWSLQDHDFYWLLLSREQTLSSGDLQDRILRALIKADSFLDSDPAQARRLVSRFIGEGDESPRSWERYYFDFTLPQPLLSVMEEEARWAIENKLTDADRVPNYLDYLDLSSLKRIHARAVTVIQ